MFGRILNFLCSFYCILFCGLISLPFSKKNTTHLFKYFKCSPIHKFTRTILLILNIKKMHCKNYKRGNNFIYLKLPRVVELSSLLNNLITESFSLKLSEKLARAKVNQ